jgi:ketosteroid isomerase-like protein
MQVSRIIVLVLIVVPLLLADTNDDYDIVAAGNKKWMGFFNSGNALSLAQLYVQDAVLVTPGAQKFVQGNTNIAATFKSLYDQKMITHVTLTSKQVQRVNGTVIAELGQYENQSGGKGMYYVVWGKIGNNYMILTDTMIN